MFELDTESKRQAAPLADARAWLAQMERTLKRLAEKKGAAKKKPRTATSLMETDAMSTKKEHFRITGKVKVQFDFANRKAVISCKTKEGLALDLETDIDTLDKINAEVRRQLDNS